jgi:hypothetical protein
VLAGAVSAVRLPSQRITLTQSIAGLNQPARARDALAEAGGLEVAASAAGRAMASRQRTGGQWRAPVAPRFDYSNSGTIKRLREMWGLLCGVTAPQLVGPH